ncbi:MAG: zf-HC2 domain-containing protein [Pseudomonadota bacterium]
MPVPPLVWRRTMMNCKEATRLMSQELEHKLSFGTRLGLRLHLLICRGCRATERHFAFLRTAARRIGSPQA